jgi:hypothetical protein
MSDLKVVLKAKMSNIKPVDRDVVIINDEMIRYGYAQTIWDAAERKTILPVAMDESEVEVYKLERIFKYLDDFTSSNMSKWDYDDEDEDDTNDIKQSEKYEFVRM